MRSHWIASALVIILAGMLLAGSLAAQDSEKPKKKSLVDIATEAMDETASKAGLPGEYHALLEQLAGSWTYSGKIWMQPGAPPMETSGTTEIKMILGGRYLRQELTGSFMGQEFKGLGFSGYDNTIKKFQGVWMDNMSTGILHTSGQGDLDKKTITSFGKQIDPRTGKAQKFKSVTTITSGSEFVDVMFNIGENGEEMKSMEMIYKRE
jgi:hypothetical protein